MRPHICLTTLMLLLLLCAGCAKVPAAPPATPIPMLIPATMPPPTPRPVAEASARQVARLIPHAHDATLTAFTTDDFAGSGTCIACHVPMVDQSGIDVSTPTHWRSSMMANASKDPIWQAKVSSEVLRNPGLQEVIEEKCATCHTPMAETQALVEGKPIIALGDGFLNPNNPLHAAAMDGISCTLCHQLQPENFGQRVSFSGGYVVDTSTAPPDRILFGPFPQPVGELMQAATGFKAEYGPHMKTSEHCATCHNLYTPYVDAAGNVLGEFPEQTPYSEWLNSTFGQTGISCQNCHMPTADGGVVLATVPPGLPARQPFSQHHFAGGNAFMLAILNDNAAEIGVTAEYGQLAFTYERIWEQLGRAATLELKRASHDGETLTLDLALGVGTGHKFPTSFPSRRAWLHVTVTDGAGQVIFESGRPQADGSIVGNDADSDPTKFEPHHDVITAADQVQIYEPIMGDTDGNVTYTLLRGATYLKDNRLLPLGFDKQGADKDIAVYGLAASDTNFEAGEDLVTYQINVAGAPGPFTVAAELLYQPISFRFVQDLLLDQSEEIERFSRYYAAADKMPQLISAIRPTVVE